MVKSEMECSCGSLSVAVLLALSSASPLDDKRALFDVESTLCCSAKAIREVSMLEESVNWSMAPELFGSKAFACFSCEDLLRRFLALPGFARFEGVL